MRDYNLCRICLNEDINGGDMHPIFDDIGLLHKIEECSGIMLKEHEEFPRLLCQQCYEDLTTSHKFRLLCHASEQALLDSIIKSECKTEPQNENATTSQSDDDISNGNDDFYELPTDFMNASEIELVNMPIEAEHEDDEEDEEGDQFTDIESLAFVGTETGAASENSEIEFLEDDEDEVIELNDSVRVQIKKRVPAKTIRELPTRRRGRAKALPPAQKRKSQPTVKHQTATTAKGPTRRGRKKLTDEQTTVPSIMCEVCGNTYLKQSLLNMHMRRHMADKPFDCEICGKTFACPSEIRRHMRVHTGEKPYVCKFCGRTFADRSTNIKHERIHTNDRPFQCNTCGKTFTYSNVLKNHMLTHTGEKPFSCVTCNKTFSRKHQLDQHYATLTHQQTIKNISAELDQMKMEVMDEGDTEIIGATAVVESTVMM